MADAVADAPTEQMPAVPAPEKADKKADKKAGAKKDAKKADKKGKGAEPDAGGGPSIAGHPRAVRSIARFKGWCGLVGFLLGAYMSHSTSTVAGAGLRALVAGVVCYVAGWAAAVFVWRRIVMLELRARQHALATAAAGPNDEQSRRGGRSGARDGA